MPVIGTAKPMRLANSPPVVIGQTTGINISPLPVWMEEWEHPEAYVNPALLANIAREGIRL